MTQKSLERRQVWIYLAAIFAGLAVGLVVPGLAHAWEILLWPLLGLLLFATFTQVPLVHVPGLVRDTRFLLALLLGNFLLLPALVGLLSRVPSDPAVRLGVMLVLLMPCTDWFISFTHLGGGDARRAILAAPILLILQLLLLPAYIWFFMGGESFELALTGPLLTTFTGIILLPLLLAWGLQHRVDRAPDTRALLDRLGRLPIPLLALVVFLIASTQVGALAHLTDILAQVFLLFVLYLLIAAVIGWSLGRVLRLPTASVRTLIFSFGTRNSFLVLPIALTLPQAWQGAVVVIVFQSLVELFGMMAYLRWVPSLPDQ